MPAMLDVCDPVQSAGVSLFFELKKVWNLQRVISNQASLSGYARFADTERAGVLQYNEQGLLKLNAARPLNAYRQYFYRQTNSGFDVFFDKKLSRLFHTVSLVRDSASSILTGSAIHHCGEDIYESYYRFELPFRFMIEHRVLGPKKSYNSFSTYISTTEQNK